jgi:hypothetical protein
VTSVVKTLAISPISCADHILFTAVCRFSTYGIIAGIVLINVAVIFVNFMGLIKFGNVFVTAMVGVSILIIAVMER